MPHGKSHEARGLTAGPVTVKVRATSALHMHSNNADITMATVQFGWRFSLRVTSLPEHFQSQFVIENGVYSMYFADILKAVKAVMCQLIVPPPLFFHQKSRFLHINLNSQSDSLCLWCMERRVSSYRDQPSAASLMGYGPQLHLFRYNSLLISARHCHVNGWSEDGTRRWWFERQQDHAWFHGYYPTRHFKNKTSPPFPLSRGGAGS